MPSIDRPLGDLHTLTRAADSARSSGVPAPKFAWKTRVVIPGVILLVLLLLVAYAAHDALWPARAVRVVPVVTKTGAASGATSTVQAPGWVEADPYSIAVSALADGIVREMLALEGQEIKAGDVVARMVDDDAKLSLAKTEADLAQRRAQLDAAQRTWDNPIERTRAVATSEAMVAEANASLQRLDAEIAVEVAKLTTAKFDAERTAQSLETRAASEIETIRAKQEYEAQKAVVEATKARGPVLRAQLAQRTAELTAAEENLRLRIEEAGALAESKAQFALATAARDEAALRLARMEVRSPVNGIVLQRLAVPGAKLVMNMDDPHSSHVVLLYDPKRLQVRVDIPLADAAKVGVGQEAKIVVGVSPDRTFEGKVTRIVNEADVQKNTLQVKVAIADPSRDLKPEMLARVRFVTNGAMTRGADAGGGQTVFAPLDLIHRHGSEAHVFVIDPRRGVAVRKTVALGETQQDGWIAITSGLEPGDQVIAEDFASLRDGQRVRVAGEASPSMDMEMKGPEHGSH